MKPITEMTFEDLISDEVINDIFSGKTVVERERRLSPYLQRATELGKKQRYEKFISDIVKEETAKSRSLAIKNRATSIQVAKFDVNGKVYNLSTPGWTVDNTGIYKFFENSGMERRACYRPIFPIKVLRNVEDSKEKVKLCFLDGYKKWNTRIFDRSLLSSGSKITQLASYGVDVTSETCKPLVEFLSTIENNNLDVIDRGLSTSKFGWKTYEGKKLFIPYDNAIEFDSEERFKTLSEAIKPQGEYETWLACAKRIRGSGRKEPFVYLVASFASIMVQPLGLLPFIVNLWTETGKGKTVALMLACSVWGDPSEGTLLTDPTSTRTALEQRCTALNNLPMFIDDLSKMKDGVEIDFTNMIYFLCGGKGKERSNTELGMEVVGTWKNCILTNMERPLANETMRGGAVNRVIDFQSEEGSYFMFDGRDKGREIVKTLKANYGFAGKMFVNVLKDITPVELKDGFEKYVTKIKEQNEIDGVRKEEKQIAPLAVLLLADELIEKHIFKDGQRMDFNWTLNQLKDADEINENQRAYETLMSAIVSAKKTHFNPDVNIEQWGFIDDGYVWILPTAMREIGTRYNFSPTVLCGWALKNNLLKHDYESGRARYTKKKLDKNMGTYQNYYVFKLPVQDTINIDDLSPAEIDELPFEVG